MVPVFTKSGRSDCGGAGGVGAPCDWTVAAAISRNLASPAASPLSQLAQLCWFCKKERPVVSLAK